MASEFDLIKRYFKPLSSGLSQEELGIGDDGAVLNVPDNHQLVVVTDTMVSGVHFPEATSPFDIGWKALAVNLSDLAAMAAKPGFFSLALTLPENDDEWLQDFARGLSALASKYQVPLVGGDTTKGPLTVTVAAHGWVESGKAVLRKNAKPGDVICVTNTIGDGALGLKIAQQTLPQAVEHCLNEDEKQYLLGALNRPEPQLNMVDLLATEVSSAIDISDGLLADLNHILENSNLAKSQHDAGVSQLTARLNLEEIPLSKAARVYIEHTGDWSSVLAGGDDYQLCFTMPESKFEKLKSSAELNGVLVTKIGYLLEGEGILQLLRDGQVIELDKAKGFLHF